MRAAADEGGDNGSSRPVTVSVRLPAELAGRLEQFCREYRVTPDRVVERALEDYFREGDMSH
ncbi:MAG: hypothetical protein AB1346_11070 [Thermodesulfobacteriota bacterium]